MTILKIDQTCSNYGRGSWQSHRTKEEPIESKQMSSLVMTPLTLGVGMTVQLTSWYEFDQTSKADANSK